MPGKSLRALPSIERLLSRPAIIALCERSGRERIRDLLREITDETRQAISEDGLRGRLTSEELIEQIERAILERAGRLARPSLRRLVNATGVIIHTNFGRAPLADDALQAILETSERYSNLEFDIEKGERGNRESHCRELLARLTAGEAAVVVNNNAAAVLLVLNTLAEGGEVIVSRGELVEIGGSFRIPDVMKKSGARLREVGTTNRTRLSDYEQAINESTRLILRVHPSNYRIIGFTERPSVAQIANLARKAGVSSYEDLGSGCLLDMTGYGVSDEPVVSDSLKAGISIVSFSGDKLLGGPQAGLIAGSRELVDRVKKNPLMRALRVDKMTYAAIEATLRIYERGAAADEIPVIRAIADSKENIKTRAEGVMKRIAVLSQDLKPALADGVSVIGGGSAPGVELPTVLITLEQAGLSAHSIQERLRAFSTPVVTRTEDDRVVIDLRTVRPDEEDILVEAVRGLLAGKPETAASADA